MAPLAAFLCLAGAAGVLASTVAAPEVAAMVDAGQFSAAQARIAESLATHSFSSPEREALEFQRERMRRILLDFTLNEEAAKARVREQIPDLRDEEFAAWDSQGLLEHRVIDGQRLYFSRAPSNLFRLSAEAVARRKQSSRLERQPS